MSGGSQDIDQGGTAVGTVLRSGFLTVSGDGVARAALVSAGGTMLVAADADCLSAAVFSSGRLDVQGETSGTVLHGGLEFVTNDGLSRNATVASGGEEDLAANGSAVGTLVLSGGDLEVDTGGTAISTTLSGGFMRVGRSDALNDGSPETLAIRTSVAAGTLVISTGGTAISGFIGGTAIVEAGGVALDLEFGGVLNLSSGGTAIRTIIQSLETVENVFAGATDLSATVIFGSQNIFSGGEAEDASVFGSLAVQTVFSGGTAVRSQLIADTRQDVRSGGTSLMTTALHGSEERVAGIAISSVVDSGGMLNVSGGTAIGGHVLAGSAIVQALGVALGIGVGGTLKLSAGGTAIDADFDEGLEQIFSGGTDIRGSIFEASQTIFAGGESDDAVLAIAAQTVSSGGFALRTVLKTIGEELVLAHRCKRPCSINRSRLWRGERSERWSNPAAE